MISTRMGTTQDGPAPIRGVHNESTGATADRSFEWTSAGGVSRALINAMAEEKSVDPIHLEPLYSVIDPDALDALFQDTAVGGTVSFMYHGYRIVVEACGRGYLYDLSDIAPANPATVEVFED